MFDALSIAYLCAERTVPESSASAEAELAHEISHLPLLRGGRCDLATSGRMIQRIRAFGRGQRAYTAVIVACSGIEVVKCGDHRGSRTPRRDAPQMALHETAEGAVITLLVARQRRSSIDCTHACLCSRLQARERGRSEREMHSILMCIESYPSRRS